MKKLIATLVAVAVMAFTAAVAGAAPTAVTYNGVAFSGENIGETDMGKVVVNGDKILITGSGADVWGNADAFYYMYRPIEGDFTATAKVTQVSDADAWAKCGIMLRATTEAGSIHSIVAATNTNNLALQWRPELDGASQHIAGTDSYENGTPVYLQLVRKGDKVTGAYSFDAKAWTAFEITDDIVIPGKALIGIFHTSHNAGETGVDGVVTEFVVK